MIPSGERSQITFIINSLVGGGAERVFCALLSHSGERLARHDVRVLLLDNEEEAYSLPPQIPIERLDCSHSMPRSLWRVRRTLRRDRPDLTVSFLTRSNVASILAMRSMRRPAIISERVNTAAHLSTGRLARLSHALVGFTYPRASHVLAVSSGVKHSLARDFDVAMSRMTTCYNPVDVDTIRAAAREEPPFLVDPSDAVAMGRLVTNKNFSLAIKGFAKSGRPGRLLILGTGPMREQLQAEIDQQGLSDRVLLKGFSKNPHSIIARAGLFIQTSNAEGFSNALVEAMAHGLACVTTDCQSGPSEILDISNPEQGSYVTGRGGLLVRTRDVDGLAHAIAAASDPALRDLLGREGAIRVLDFTVERAVDTFWTCIEKTLANGHPSP